MKLMLLFLIILSTTVSCSNTIDKTIFDKEKEPGIFNKTYFNQSNFN